MKLSNFQYSIARMFISVVLYALYCLLVYGFIAIYFHPNYFLPTMLLGVAISIATMFFHAKMPKRSTT
jgi:hypothetical protein